MSTRLDSFPRWVQEEALHVAELSRAAYGNKGFTLPDKYLIENKKTDTQCYVFRIDNIVYATFRGTQKKLRDILTDLFFFKKKVPFDHTGKIRIHSGFYNAYESVCEAVRNRVQELLMEGANTVVVGGHSMGGDLDVLCTVDLQYHKIIDKENLRSYPYNMAKIGNRYFRDSFNKRVPFCLRIKNRLDPVSMVPVTSCHVGTKVVLKGKIGHDINNCIYNIINTLKN